MTWAKFGVEFFDECAQQGLSDAAVRTHCEALGYLYRVEAADMRLRRNVIPRFAGSEDWEAAVSELIAAGFWSNEGSVIRVVHHGDVFRSGLAAQQLKRERDKVAQQRARAKAARVSAEVVAYVSADISADVATDRVADTGADVNDLVSGDADRQSFLQTAAVEREQIDELTGEVKGWPAPIEIPRPAAGPVTRNTSTGQCPAPECTVELKGIEVKWGICADHKRQGWAG